MIVRLRSGQVVFSAIMCSGVLALLSYASASGGTDPRQPRLIVAAEPQGQAKDLKYRLETPDLIALFFVRNIGDVETKNLRLSAHLHETNQTRGATVLRLSSERRRLDDGSLVLLPGEAIAVELKITGLPIGASSGYLLVEQEDSKFTLAGFAVEYHIPPHVKVVGLADGSELQRISYEGAYEHILSIQSQNETPIEELWASVTPVTGPDGVQRSATIELDSPGRMPAAMNAHAVADLRLKTVLPISGIYKGTIKLSYDAHTKEVPFSITRAKMPLPYEIMPSEAVRTDVCFGQHDTRIRVTMHELNGIDLTSQNLPELTTLNTVITGQKSYQTKFGGTSWQDDGGQVVTSLSLAPGESRALWLVVSGLDAAGEHSGSLRLNLPDGQTVTQVVSIVARKHWGFVVFFIVLGIGVSQALKLLGTRALNIQEQQQLSRIDSNAARLYACPELTAEGRSIIEQLRARILIVNANSYANRGRSYAAEIGELDRKIRMTPRWNCAAEAARAIHPPATGLLAQVEQLKEFLLTENSSLQDLQANEQQLTKLKNDVDTKARELLTDAIRFLAHQITRYEELQSLSDDSIMRLQAMKQLLVLSEDAVIQSQLRSAQGLYERASREYASSLVMDLKEQVKRPPAVFEQHISLDRWAEVALRLGDDLDQALQFLHDDPNASMRRVWRIRANYWSQSLRLVVAVIQNTANSNQNPPAPDLAEIKLLLEATRGFAEQLNGLETAAEISPEELLAFEQRIKILNTLGGEKKHDATHALEAASGSGRLLARLPQVQLHIGTDTESVRLADVKALHSLRWWNEFWIIFLSAIVAVVLGIKLLWIDNIVWGASGDYLIAILWGLGLHQVANASFDFNSHVTRLTKSAGKEIPTES